MHPAHFLRFRYSLNTMHPCLEAQFLKYSLHFHFYRRLLISAESTGRRREYFRAPIFKIGIEHIHIGEFLGKESRFLSTGAGAHFQNNFIRKLLCFHVFFTFFPLLPVHYFLALALFCLKRSTRPAMSSIFVSPV